MKHKTLLAFSFLFFSCYALNAQIDKGNILLGGTLGFNSGSQTGYYSSSNTNLNPRITYAIGKNSVIGLAGSFSRGATKYSGPQTNKTINTSYGGSFFWRKYLPVQNRLGWYTEVNAGIWEGRSKTKSLGSPDQIGSSTTYGIGALPGVYFMALPKLLLSANVGGVNFSRSINKGDSNYAQSRSSFFYCKFSK